MKSLPQNQATQPLSYKISENQDLSSNKEAFRQFGTAKAARSYQASKVCSIRESRKLKEEDVMIEEIACLMKTSSFQAVRKNLEKVLPQLGVSSKHSLTVEDAENLSTWLAVVFEIYLIGSIDRFPSRYQAPILRIQKRLLEIERYAKS
ncbi:MAG: hypothetical protein KGV50_02455 [Gammaproteobacteria bacterium]|nr:hypothetical protein [Gammaproteobacteria bacterium]